MSKPFKIGLTGSSQLSFFGDKKGVFSRMADKLTELSPELGYELFVYPKSVVTADDAYEAVRALEDEKVDFLLLQCTSFSAGYLAPIFARINGASLGLWAIPEFAEGGPVPFNSFCSINMYSSVIGHYLNNEDIPFKWFYGDVDDELFIERFKVTVRALRAIKKLKQSSVAVVGGCAPGFDDLYDDERKIVQRLKGIRINRLHEWGELRDRAVKYKPEDVEPYIEKILKNAKGVHDTAKSQIERSARFEKAYDDFIAETGYDGVAVSCWPKFQDEFQYSVCSVVGNLNEKGTIAACEGDLTSAISMLLLKYISDDVTTLMDLSAFDEKDDTILMWHCGPTARRFARKNGYSLSLNYSGAPHEDGKPPRGIGVVHDMVFDPGEVTVARFAGEWDRMLLTTGAFIDSDKASFCGSRGWLGNLRFNRAPINVRDFINTLLVQQLSHHFPLVYGDWSREVMEVMAWLGLSPIKTVKYEDYLQLPVL